MRVWRISNYSDLNGKGGLFRDGRWHRLGMQIVYCADSPAAALLEVVAHTDESEIPKTYQLVEIEIPDDYVQDFGQAVIGNIVDLPQEAMFLKESGVFDWEAWFLIKNQIGISQTIGDSLLKNCSAIKVPSALVPFTWNIIINPLSVHIDKIKIKTIIRYPFDKRLN